MIADEVANNLGMLLVAAIAVLSLSLGGRRLGVAIPALVAFVVRAIRGFDVQLSGYLSDAVQYDQYAIDLVRYWDRLGPAPDIPEGKEGFPTLLGLIYSQLGYAPQVGYLVNALAGGLTVLVIASVTKNMGWDRAVVLSAWLVALWPVAVLWGGLLLREAIVTLLLACGLWGAVRLYRGRFLTGALAIVAAGLVMIPMRGGLAFMILVGLPLTVIAVMNLHFANRLGAIVFTVVGATVAVLALSFLSTQFETTELFTYSNAQIEGNDVGNSSFSQAGVGGSTVSLSLTGHLQRIPLIAIGPLPWQVTNGFLLLAWIDAMLWVTVWLLAVIGMRSLERRAEALLFMAPTAALIVYLAANSTNFGLIIRLRGLGIAFIAPIAALGYIAWRDRQREKRERRAHVRPDKRLARQRRPTVVSERS